MGTTKIVKIYKVTNPKGRDVWLPEWIWKQKDGLPGWTLLEEGEESVSVIPGAPEPVFAALGDKDIAKILRTKKGHK